MYIGIVGLHEDLSDLAERFNLAWFTPEPFQGNWPARVLGQIEEVLTDRLITFRTARSPRRGA